MKLHPAIDPDYPAGVAAFRQLAIGARPTFRAGSFHIYAREGYDHLYYRGLALRHSNGETGKYETFTYEATQALRDWAKCNQIRMTFAEALTGMDVERAIKSYKLSRSAEQRQDRTKLFASSLGKGLALTDAQRADLDHLSWTTNTADYVAAWCRVNHLKGA